MAIREGRAEDVRAISALIGDMERHELAQGVFGPMYLRLLEDPDHRFLVWTDGADDSDGTGAVLGVLHLRCEEQLHHVARVAEIMELAVADGHRSAGIGRALFDAACDAARAAGCVQIEVACNQLRHRAHRFYEARGMHNFHYKFSRSLVEGADADTAAAENRLGR